ncbi:MAG: hypothetical protein ISS34_08170, partial [Candidatus Omnitrophica bacterium]|nr:hypothetical protein [Candidatus Omnitrophota bacterium]
MSRKRVGKFGLLFIVSIGVLLLFFSPDASVQQANYSFLQTDWSSGTSTDTGVHPTNQTGWQKYTSKDDNINATFPGRIMMSTVTTQVADDTDTDFGNGTLSDLQIVGTGAAAELESIGSVLDPFYSTLGHWTNQRHMPTLDDSSAFTRVKDYPSAGNNFIYALWSGWSTRTAFAKFDISTNEWTFLEDFPAHISDGWGQGTSLCYPNGGDYIYALRGSWTKDFYRYSITDDTWEKLLDIPEYVNFGGALAAKDETTLFATVGRETTYFYKYTVSTNLWNQAQTPPWNIREGANLVYPGSGDYIYCNRGDYNTFAKYHVGSNSWSTLGNVPFNMEYGASLGYPGEGDYIYATNGTGGVSFAR